MDFGAAVGLDGLVGSDLDAKQKLYGSGFFKQLGRPYSEDADGWRVLDSTTTSKGSAKVARLGDDSFSVSAPQAVGEAAALLLPQRSSSDSFFSDAHQSQHMLCFSTGSSLLHKSESQSPGLPCFGYAASAYSNNAGLSSGGLNGGNMQGLVLGGGRAPFTPSQRMELEHQALIYKYISAKLPVPSNLLIPIRKAFESAGFCYAATGFTRPGGWGGFQLGFSSSTDPEPGRCRRTDGKKWRCSRDAVVDQKYCERHLNRGRHRSRKPVEGQKNSGHPVSGGSTGTACASTTAPYTAAANKQGLPLSSLHHSQSGVLSLSADSSLKSLFKNKEDAMERIQNPPSTFSLISASTELKSKIDSLHRTSSFSNSCLNLGTLKDLPERIPGFDHSNSPFMNNWPGMNVPSSGTTHSSISAPVASNDDKVTMNLGFGGGMVYSEHVPRQTMCWISTSSEASIGGPLGEVIHSANNSSSSTECKNSSFLNLMTEGWESSSSSPLGLSPTGVLQRTTFGSVSNSEQSAS